jgi:hypothetical protein
MDGWFDEETAPSRHWRWAGRQAVLGIWNNSRKDRNVGIAFQPVLPGSGVLEISRDGAVLARCERSAASPGILTLELTLPPGSTRLDFRFMGTLVEPAADPRRLGFSLENVTADLR